MFLRHEILTYDTKLNADFEDHMGNLQKLFTDVGVISPW